jgi:tetratricopeptide (TPR) repeat protein
MWAILGLVVLAGIGAGGWGLYRAACQRAIPSQIMAAERLLNAGKFAAASEKAANVLWWDPQQPEALSVSGRCLLGEGQADQASTVLAKVPVDSAAFEKSGHSLATAYLKSGELEQAELTLRRYLDRFPADEAARDELRWLYFNQFRTRDLINLLEEKLKLATGALGQLTTLADLLDSEFRQQVPFEGAGYLSQIDELKPGQGMVNLALGYAQWRMGNVPAARQRLQTALATHPDHPQVRFVVTAFLIEQGQLADAQAILTRPPIPETDDRYWSLRSQLAEQEKNATAALEYLDRAVQLHGNDQRYAGRRVTLLRELGRDQEVAPAAKVAHELLQADRELADLVEARAHYQPTRPLAVRIATLCQQLGKSLQARYWQALAPQLPEGKATR